MLPSGFSFTPVRSFQFSTCWIVIKITQDTFAFKSHLRFGLTQVDGINSLTKMHGVSVLGSQYHVCWCTDDFRSQCISRHGIDTQSRNIPSPASDELKALVSKVSVASKIAFWELSAYWNMFVQGNISISWNGNFECLRFMRERKGLSYVETMKIL